MRKKPWLSDLSPSISYLGCLTWPGKPARPAFTFLIPALARIDVTVTIRWPKSQMPKSKKKDVARCSVCRGSGRIDGKVCTVCEGTGEIVVHGRKKK